MPFCRLDRVFGSLRLPRIAGGLLPHDRHRRRTAIEAETRIQDEGADNAPVR
jgi:hypothetical protein